MNRQTGTGTGMGMDIGMSMSMGTDTDTRTRADTVTVTGADTDTGSERSPEVGQRANRRRVNANLSDALDEREVALRTSALRLAAQPRAHYGATSQ